MNTYRKTEKMQYRYQNEHLSKDRKKCSTDIKMNTFRKTEKNENCQKAAQGSNISLVSIVMTSDFLHQISLVSAIGQMECLRSGLNKWLSVIMSKLIFNLICCTLTLFICV